MDSWNQPVAWLIQWYCCSSFFASNVGCADACLLSVLRSMHQTHTYLYHHIGTFGLIFSSLGWVTLFWPSGVVTKYEWGARWETEGTMVGLHLPSSCSDTQSPTFSFACLSYSTFASFVIFYCTTYFMFLIFGLSWSGVGMRLYVILPFGIPICHLVAVA